MTVNYPLYGTHSELWPLVSPLHSYEEEMSDWLEVLRERFELQQDIELLDLGTGGGHHLYQLCQGWKGNLGGVTVDTSEAMLRLVESLLPGFERVQADMTSVRLNRRFPLILVHDSFCYLTELTQVEALLKTIATHLKPDGLALLKLDAIADEFAGPYRYLTTFEDDEKEVTLTHYEWDPNPEDDCLEVVYLFLERRAGVVTTREERHRLGLFSRRQLARAVTAAGLTGRWLELERWDEERPNPLLVLTPTKGETTTEGNQKLP